MDYSGPWGWGLHNLLVIRSSHIYCLNVTTAFICHDEIPVDNEYENHLTLYWYLNQNSVLKSQEDENFIFISSYGT